MQSSLFSGTASYGHDLYVSTLTHPFTHSHSSPFPLTCTYTHICLSCLHPPPAHTHSFSSMEESDFSDQSLPATPLSHYQKGHRRTYSFESSGERPSTAIPFRGTPPRPRKWVKTEHSLVFAWPTCKSEHGFSVGRCINTFALMTTGAFSQNVGKLFSELKLVQITFLSISKMLWALKWSS